MGTILAGDLNRRIEIQRAATERNDLNEEVMVWAKLVDVWASWRRATARETLARSEVGATVTDMFEIRYSSTVASLNPKDRLIYHGRTYDISGVTEIGFREGLRIEAAARADGEA